MLPGLKDGLGELFVVSTPPDAGATYFGGIARSSEGAVHISETDPLFFTNGFGITAIGQVCVAFGGTIQNYLEGIPRDPAGRVVAYPLGTVPNNTSSFLGKLRIGAAGVYMNSITPPVGDVPVNTVLPLITGDAIVGETLTCSAGTWDNLPTAYSYQWYVNSVAIPAATANTYVIQASDDLKELTCFVTATNAVGGATAESIGVRVGEAAGFYSYFNEGTATPPPVGFAHKGSIGTSVRFNMTDKNGTVLTSILTSLKVGDNVTVGPQTGTVNGTPTINGSAVAVRFTAWPVLADGDYSVTFTIL